MASRPRVFLVAPKYKPMKKLLFTIGCVAALAAASLFIIPSPAIAEPLPKKGVMCTIQFRRDALGTAASLPVSPLTGSINGAETSVSGKLVQMSSEWIIVEAQHGEIWVPKAVVLLLQFQNK